MISLLSLQSVCTSMEKLIVCSHCGMYFGNLQEEIKKNKDLLFEDDKNLRYCCLMDLMTTVDYQDIEEMYEKLIGKIHQNVKESYSTPLGKM